MDAADRLVVAELLAMPSVAWSLGSFGAIAEFMWQADEGCAVGRDGLSQVTSRGAIRLVFPSEAVLLRYTTPSRLEARRRKEMSLCLPFETSRMAGRGLVTELGPDADALRDQERGHVLFDIGLAQHQVDACVRTGDPETIAILRYAVGRSAFDPSLALMREMPRLSPHRVFVTRCGRIEVYQKIPPVDGKSPDGPHTHVLPKLLRAGRTHAASLPIPDGLTPCLTIHLSHQSTDHVAILAQEGH